MLITRFAIIDADAHAATIAARRRSPSTPMPLRSLRHAADVFHFAATFTSDYVFRRFDASFDTLRHLLIFIMLMSLMLTRDDDAISPMPAIRRCFCLQEAAWQRKEMREEREDEVKIMRQEACAAVPRQS